MVEFLHGILEYHKTINDRIIERMLEQESLVKDKSLFLLTHSIIANQIWNARILNETPMSLDSKLTLLECEQLHKESFNKTFEILRRIPLEREISYQNSKGDHFNNSLLDILFHISNHYSHHRGHLLAELRASGISPIISDYIFYKR